MSVREILAFWGGPLGFALALMLLPTSGEINQAALAGTAWWMLWWWVGGAVALGPTSLLPIALFPALGVMDIQVRGSPFWVAIYLVVSGGLRVGIGLGKAWLAPAFCLAFIAPNGGRATANFVGLYARHGPDEHVDFKHSHHADDAAHGHGGFGPA